MSAIKFDDVGLLFPQEYLRAALMVSLLSVWVLVGLFFYLNRYTRREYFTIWTAAWLFYALWLTLSLRVGNPAAGSILFTIKQCCVSISAVFLLWGSLRFLSLPVQERQLGGFMAFLVVWTFVSPKVMTSVLQVEMPVFILLGSSSLFAGVCFFRLRKQRAFVGAGMLSLGFLLWGLYLGSYPFSQQYGNLYSAGFFIAAVLQLFIAVSMIVLVLEEVRYNAEKVRAEIAAVMREKEALQVKVITAEEECQSLYNRVRLTEGTQKAYDELRRAQQAVVQQERLRALGQMASGMAHDINNALSPITAYAELLLSTLPDLEDIPRQRLQRIRQAGEDVAQIVARMREFYRRDIDPDELDEVNVNKAIEDVIELTRPRWRDLAQRQGISIQVKFERDPGEPVLVCNSSELREALTNVIFNAVDALPQGGAITLLTRHLDVKTGPPEDGTVEKKLQIEVRDNGVGMDEKVRQHCLEPFFSTKHKTGGTGLGLAMVYGMVKRHDGCIEFESAPNRGTCVRLIFPIRKRTTSAVRSIASPPVPSRSLRILCIDDDPELRLLLRDVLEVHHHKVTVAAGGMEGVQLFRSNLGGLDPFDMVITDLGMPEMDGHHVARAIKAESPRTPIIMLTGWGAMMQAEGESTPEVDAVLSKPPRIQELTNVLDRICAIGQKPLG
ncbi:MAG TPA: ATP-binding protein [Candidatus Baltobacteraceae bacterium]|jgi:signal transduction histidine kinase/ActR/RegA family two-component response regulator|nr:ATP-binding protein [Candidatus Baltobacteraceae bacterium]